MDQNHREKIIRSQIDAAEHFSTIRPDLASWVYRAARGHMARQTWRELRDEDGRPDGVLIPPEDPPHGWCDTEAR